MRYIKLFEEHELSDEYRSLVNFDLVNDLKDMSLDYLDKGLKLNIVVCYDYGSFEKSIINGMLYNLIYSHDQEEEPKLNYDWTEEKNDGKIVYYIYFSISKYRGSMVHCSSTLKTFIPFEEELVDRIKAAYPDENIKNIKR